MHKVPVDLHEALINEWVCWVLAAKKEETRKRKIKRTLEELNLGKRRPCCWAGCPHR